MLARALFVDNDGNERRPPQELLQWHVFLVAHVYDTVNQPLCIPEPDRRIPRPCLRGGSNLARTVTLTMVMTVSPHRGLR